MVPGNSFAAGEISQQFPASPGQVLRLINKSEPPLPANISLAFFRPLLLCCIFVGLFVVGRDSVSFCLLGSPQSLLIFKVPDFKFC